MSRRKPSTKKGIYKAMPVKTTLDTPIYRNDPIVDKGNYTIQPVPLYPSEGRPRRRRRRR